MIIYALLIIVMMLVRPQGLFGIKLQKKKKITAEQTTEPTMKE
jgi:hypothetical protein